jgi:hypothetical protein
VRSLHPGGRTPPHRGCGPARDQAQIHSCQPLSRRRVSSRALLGFPDKRITADAAGDPDTRADDRRQRIGDRHRFIARTRVDGPPPAGSARAVCELAWSPVVDQEDLARRTGISAADVAAGLAWLSASGRLGYDLVDRAWFHRELPVDSDRVLRRNPRLVAARALAFDGPSNPRGWLAGARQPGRPLLGLKRASLRLSVGDRARRRPGTLQTHPRRSHQLARLTGNRDLPSIQQLQAHCAVRSSSLSARMSTVQHPDSGTAYGHADAVPTRHKDGLRRSAAGSVCGTVAPA